MRVIKAMGKALLTLLSFVGIAKLIAAIIQISKIDPMIALGVISLIGVFAAATIGFYIIDNDK